MHNVREQRTPNGHTWYRLENDAYGGPRVMTHFMNLVSPMQIREADRLNGNDACASIGTLEKWAKECVNGRSYTAKWFGGGIVWRSYLGDSDINALIDCINANC